MTHLVYIPVEYLWKLILLRPIGRHSAQLCSIRWEIFIGGFWDNICDIKCIRSGSLPISFYFLSPTQGKQNLPSLKTDCALKSAGLIHFSNGSWMLRIETQRSLFSDSDLKAPAPPFIVRIPVLRMVLCVFLPRLHPSSDTLLLDELIR